GWPRRLLGAPPLHASWQSWSTRRMRARIGSRHFDQNLRQPIRGIDHHVVAGSGRLEGAPRLVGLALCERLVEGRLRIVRGADIALLRHLSRAPVSLIGCSATPFGCPVTFESTQGPSFSLP